MEQNLGSQDIFKVIENWTISCHNTKINYLFCLNFAVYSKAWKMLDSAFLILILLEWKECFKEKQQNWFNWVDKPSTEVRVKDSLSLSA